MAVRLLAVITPNADGSFDGITSTAIALCHLATCSRCRVQAEYQGLLMYASPNVSPVQVMEDWQARYNCDYIHTIID